MKAIIFDLDGTLVDTVHAHVLSWQRAMCEFGMEVDAANIHKRVGMGSRLLIQECAREVGCRPSSDEMAGMDGSHSSIFGQLLPEPRALNGARELLRDLKCANIKCGVATSGKRADIESALAVLGLPPEFVVIDGDSRNPTKPEPNLFLECQQRLGAAIAECYVVGDSIWDVLAARRAGFLSIGLLCGGSSADDLYRACAFRVYTGPAELRNSLAELGF